MGRTEQVEEESVVASILAPLERPARRGAHAEAVVSLGKLIDHWRQERQKLEGRDVLGTSVVYDWILTDAREIMHSIDNITQTYSGDTQADDDIAVNLKWLVTVTQRRCERLYIDATQSNYVVSTQKTLSTQLFDELSEFVE